MKPKFTGSRHTGLGASIGKSSAHSAADKRPSRHSFYAVCIDNAGNPASLVLGKAYRVVRPRKNDPRGMFRVVDEDAEDYLYDSRQFVPIDLPLRARKLLAAGIDTAIRPA